VATSDETMVQRTGDFFVLILACLAVIYLITVNSPAQTSVSTSTTSVSSTSLTTTTTTPTTTIDPNARSFYIVSNHGNSTYLSAEINEVNQASNYSIAYLLNAYTADGNWYQAGIANNWSPSAPGDHLMFSIYKSGLGYTTYVSQNTIHVGDHIKVMMNYNQSNSEVIVWTCDLTKTNFCMKDDYYDPDAKAFIGGINSGFETSVFVEIVGESQILSSPVTFYNLTPPNFNTAQFTTTSVMASWSGRSVTFNS
jgi:hypothetical protein